VHDENSSAGSSDEASSAGSSEEITNKSDGEESDTGETEENEMYTENVILGKALTAVYLKAMELSTLIAKTKATIAEPDQSTFLIEGMSSVIKSDRDLRGGYVW